jgi:site-specific recombinase XerD
MTSTDEERRRRAVNPEETAQEGHQHKQLSPFVLYSLRHTFLTRLGALGCDVWTLARIAGHSSIAMSYRYVHPSEDCVLDVMEMPGGQETGHTNNIESHKWDSRITRKY